MTLLHLPKISRSQASRQTYRTPRPDPLLFLNLSLRPALFPAGSTSQIAECWSSAQDRPLWLPMRRRPTLMATMASFRGVFGCAVVLL